MPEPLTDLCLAEIRLNWHSPNTMSGLTMSHICSTGNMLLDEIDRLKAELADRDRKLTIVREWLKMQQETL